MTRSNAVVGLSHPSQRPVRRVTIPKSGGGERPLGKHWRLSGRGEAFRAHIVSYADEFVILSRGRAEEALAWTEAVMTKLGLTLNEVKTSVKNARKESFDFLGYTLGPRHFPIGAGGTWRKPIQEERAASEAESQRTADAG
jgi:hypothetical protein